MNRIIQDIDLDAFLATRNGNEGEQVALDVIANDENLLRIDFIYHSTSKYINGGWVQMHKDTYIQPKGSELRYPLLASCNMPIAPKKHLFKQAGEILFYSLFFPAVPKDTTHLDIIESKTMENAFNLYQVPMQTVLNSIIKIY